MSYADYIARKLSTVPPTGLDDFTLPASLFDHQKTLTGWALRRGRAAIFADTGLGKSRMQIAWADAVRRHTKRPVLILAPLAVAAQTVGEAAELGVEAVQCREQADAEGVGIAVTNYDRLHKFDPQAFGAVVLDESSCIKHHNTKTLATLLESFRLTPFKLCATATPAPNDWTELGTHAEFLGICTRAEMLAEFFTHDGGDTQTWRLKGHARQVFWQWVCSWGALVRRPSDLGFSDSAYALPPLHMHEHTVETDMPTNGMLFATEAQTLSERRDARRMSMEDRVGACVSLVYDGWTKLAACKDRSETHGLEEGVRGSAQEESRGRPRVQGAQKCSIGQGQGCACGVHEEVLQREPGEVQAHAAAILREESQATGEVRIGCGPEGCCARSCEGLAAGQSSQAQGATATEVRNRAVGLRGSDGDSGRSMRDMRHVGHVEAEHVSSGGSLPHDWQSSRLALHGLQSRAGQVQGRPEQAIRGDCVLDEAWLIWCELNDEQDALELAFGDRAFSVRGPMSAEDKESAIRRWLAGERPVMIAKPSIMGWGINAQHCRNVAFVGVTDSFESYYQAVRRCWRFGQRRDVHVHVFASSAEGAVVANLKRKERDALAMAEALSTETRGAVMAQVRGAVRETNSYDAGRRVAVPAFLRRAA